MFTFGNQCERRGLQIGKSEARGKQSRDSDIFIDQP